MGHVVRRMPWGTIDVDTTLGRVFFQQTWSYTWDIEAPMAPWTYPEQHAFHTLVDRQIWSSWSYRVTLGVRGRHPLVTRLGRSGLTINFDIRWMQMTRHPEAHRQTRHRPLCDMIFWRLPMNSAT